MRQSIITQGTTHSKTKMILSDLSQQQINGNMGLGARLPQCGTRNSNGSVLESETLLKMQQISQKQRLKQVQPTYSKTEFSKRSKSLSQLKNLHSNQSNAMRQLQRLDQERKLVKMINQAFTGKTNDFGSRFPASDTARGAGTRFGFQQTRFSRFSSLPKLHTKDNWALGTFNSEKLKKSLTKTQSVKFLRARPISQVSETHKKPPYDQQEQVDRLTQA